MTKHQPRTKSQKIILIIIVVIFLIVSSLTAWIFISIKQEFTPVAIPHVIFPDPIYSALSGKEIPDANLNNSPIYCVQIPNGLDGARPQAGLHQAAVVFEAIAEAGITRFAAIFQNPTTSAIGPIRSLRPYYLDWDLPFGCTVVHQGGSTEALTALRQSGANNLEEDNYYTWRELNATRRWNNLFTSSQNLANFSQSYEISGSTLQPFSRLTPDEAFSIAQSPACSTGAEAYHCRDEISTITIRLGNNPDFNPVYVYNPTTNDYARSYETGTPHLSYDCPADLTQPQTQTDCNDPLQLTPDVVIAMYVQENLMADGYHEQITTTGQGKAIIFQNGTAIEGTWSKTTPTEQITFYDQNSQVIKLTPGQVWITAVPQSGSIEY